MQTEILNEMEVVYDKTIEELGEMFVPSDTQILFQEASPNVIKATIASNNMSMFSYHRSNLQNQAIFQGIYVYLSASIADRRPS